MAEDLPKHKLLVKLLKMTTSTNDGEALTAMRKANDLLLAASWDWERLLAGKIVVVGDPFASLDTPPPRSTSTSAPTPPSRPPPPVRATPPRPAQTPPRAAAPPTRPRAPIKISHRANLYPGPCWCCGTYVDVDKGFVFDLAMWWNKTGWKVACTACNDRGHVPQVAARRQSRPIDSPLADVSLSDL